MAQARLEKTRDTTVQASFNLRMARLYPGHAYGTSVTPDAAHLGTSPQLRDQLDQAMAADHLALVVAGDVDLGPELEVLVNKYFAAAAPGLPKASPIEPAASPLPDHRTLDVLDAARMTQVHIAIGVRFEGSPTAEDDAGLMAYEWLLERDLERGMADKFDAPRNISVHHQRFARGTSVLVDAAVLPPYGAEATKWILGRIDATRRDLTPGQAERATIEAVRTVPLLFPSIEGAAARESEAVLNIGDPTFWERYKQALAALGADGIRAAAGRLAVGKEAIVLSGDAGAIGAALTAAGMAPIP